MEVTTFVILKAPIFWQSRLQTSWFTVNMEYYMRFTSHVSHQSMCTSAGLCIQKYLPSTLHVSGPVLSAGSQTGMTLDLSGS